MGKSEVARESEPTAAPPRELSPEEAEAVEERRYGNQRFSDMYYPQYFEVYRPDPRAFNNRKIQRGPVKCMQCGELSKETLRFEPKDKYYCVPCLRKLGVCILPGSRNHLPVEIVLTIALFLDDYRDLCSFARVSWTWFNAVNYDRAAENDMTRIKRYLIGREVHVQFERTNQNNELATDFVNRFEVGRIIGEWAEADLKRKLALARHVHDSAYYAKPLNLQSTSADLGSYDLANETFTIGKEIVVYGPKHNADGHFTVHTKTKDNKPLVLILDRETGTVLSYRTADAPPASGKAPGGDGKEGKKCDVM